MHTAITFAITTVLMVSAIVPPTGKPYGLPGWQQTRAEQRQSAQPASPRKSYDVYFPNVTVPTDAGISLVRLVVTCGKVSAVTGIPDDWYVRPLRPATESGADWAEFSLAWNAIEFEAGHGVTRLSDLKTLDGAIKIAVEDESCFDVVADIKDELGTNGWKTRLRKAQLQLRN